MIKDKLVADLIADEEKRQKSVINLIPSENIVSDDVREALGSVFTNKYAEGYPGMRYYGGQEFTDKLEQLAIDRAKKLFHADHANVQSHSGAPANDAVYNAWLEPGDTVLAMRLDHGGHLTHGAKNTRTAKLYNFIHYGIKDVETGEIDYEQMRELALKHKPKIIVAGFSSYPRSLDYAKFVEIGNEVGALLMADMAHMAGLIAGGVADNPLDFGFHVMTMTTHKTLRGPRGGMILSMGKVSSPLRAPEKTINNIPTLIDRSVFPGIQGGPHMNVIAAKAVCLYEAAQPSFREYITDVVKNAKLLAEELKKRGFVVVTGGTDNHIVLVDIYKTCGIDGKEAQERLEKNGIIVNANAVPNDPLPPYRPSGIRLGTSILSTAKSKSIVEIAKIISAIK
jgi:glycine hydroxymethyltransferase